MLGYEHGREGYSPGTGKPVLVRSWWPGQGLSPGRPNSTSTHQHHAQGDGHRNPPHPLQLHLCTSNPTQLPQTTGPSLSSPRTLQAQPHTPPRGGTGHSCHRSAGCTSGLVRPKPSAHPSTVTRSYESNPCGTRLRCCPGSGHFLEIKPNFKENFLKAALQLIGFHSMANANIHQSC